ncbi:MAG: hypothetical protein K2X74_06865, partial [Acetobacteraceae bacterium]|nr:hypothetical protein [Acetobacteraceae bacterium]
AAGLAVARRGEGALPEAGTDLYVADTLGELGLFYRVAGAALVGGSLVPHGGQNPLEPARLGCPILLGPHTWNFAEPVARLRAAHAMVEVADGAALAAAAADVLSDPARRAALATAAAVAVATEAGLPERVAAACWTCSRPPAPGRGMTRWRGTTCPRGEWRRTGPGRDRHGRPACPRPEGRPRMEGGRIAPPVAPVATGVAHD